MLTRRFAMVASTLLLINVALAGSPEPPVPGPAPVPVPSVSQTHVMLTAMSYSGNSCQSGSFEHRALFRVYPNGKTGATPFEVPRGMRLVVTDVEWSMMYIPSMLPLSEGMGARLVIHLERSADVGAEVFASRSIHLDSTNIHGRPGSSEQLSTGFVVGPGATICPRVTLIWDGNQDGGSTGGVQGIERLYLRGYLAP